jgi:D-alanyl-D-alanine carboxypeptidase
VPVAGPHPPIEPVPSARALARDTAEPPAAYLAWTPGGLPTGFREGVRSLPVVERAAVFAGDTIWLTRSADRTGRIVDDPRPPYAVPIDAFAVAPREIAPFLDPEPRRAVLMSLARGRAVLGARSAVLRGLGVGGTLEFGADRVTVGAIVPEELLGWSEVLVSRATGARLGISHDRHAWIRLRGEPTLPAVVALVRRLVPAGEPLRVEPPGATPYLRAANGVNPPIVLKRAFGEFAAAVDPAIPWSFRIAPAWTEAHLVTRQVPLLGTLTCHRAFMADLLGAIREVRRRGFASSIRSTAGCFNPRTVARSPTNPPSFHAYGAAVDINAPENPFGAIPTMDPRVVEIFERRGFNWGGGFLIPDGMHFEYGGAR